MTHRQQSWDAVRAIATGSVVVGLFVLFAARNRPPTHVMSPLPSIKQVNTAIQIYISNADDTLPPLGNPGVPWTLLIMPTLKWPLIFTLPNPNRMGPVPTHPQLNGDIGYNYAALNSTKNGVLRGRKTAEIAMPTELIMIATHEASPVMLIHQPTGIAYAMSIEPPVCPPDNDLCIGGWGTDFWVKQGGMNPRSFGARHGRVDAIRYTVPGRYATAAYMDGHAGSLAAEQLTEGTDCQGPDEWLTRPCKRTGTGTYRWGEP